jgi:hypothetical protein
MLTTSELDAMRATSTAAMPDVIEITADGTGAPVLNPITGVLTPPASTVVYSGPGRLRAPTATEMERIFADREVTVQRFVCKVPWDVTTVDRGHRVRVVSGTDPDIAGRSFRIVTVLGGSNHIDRTLGCEEIVG